MIKEEIWKRNKYFLVSNTGRVKNYFSGHEYKLIENKKGYLKVFAPCERRGKKKWFFVHRLIAEAFIENKYNKLQINHKDCNKKNNNIENLEWVSAKENVAHAILNGLFNKKKKQRVSIKKARDLKISKEQVSFVIKNYIPRDPFFGSRGLGRLFNVSHKVILRALKRKKIFSQM